MHFLDSENALFEKFEGQKKAFHTENTSAKALSKRDKWLDMLDAFPERGSGCPQKEKSMGHVYANISLSNTFDKRQAFDGCT
jgi:hypothetical protein